MHFGHRKIRKKLGPKIYSLLNKFLYRGSTANCNFMLPKVTPLRCSNVHTKFGEIIFSLILSNLELNSFYLWNRHQLDQTHLFDSVQLFMLILYSTRNPKPVGFVNFNKCYHAEKYRNILPSQSAEFSEISQNFRGSLDIISG